MTYTPFWQFYMICLYLLSKYENGPAKRTHFLSCRGGKRWGRASRLNSLTDTRAHLALTFMKICTLGTLGFSKPRASLITKDWSEAQNWLNNIVRVFCSGANNAEPLRTVPSTPWGRKITLPPPRSTWTTTAPKKEGMT